jgi:hypothetical protein
MRHMILCQTVLLFLAEQAGQLLVPPDPDEPPIDPVLPAPDTPGRRGEKSAPHLGAGGHGAQWSLCPLA